MPDLKKGLVLLGLAALLGSACGTSTGGREADPADSGESQAGHLIEVTARDFSFNPAKIRLEPGETVEFTFTNDGSVEHSFTSDALGVGADAASATTTDGSFTAPEKEGVYEFHCRFHPSQMTGRVIVGNPPKGSTPEGTTEGSDENDDGYDY